jgi:hypothetical protein
MRLRTLLLLLVLPQLTLAAPTRVPVGKLLEDMIHRSTLAEPNGRPFYLKATFTDKDDPESQFTGTMEEYWVSPTKWRRVIKLREFSQTRIINGDLYSKRISATTFPPPTRCWPMRS